MIRPGHAGRGGAADAAPGVGADVEAAPAAAAVVGVLPLVADALGPLADAVAPGRAARATRPATANARATPVAPTSRARERWGLARWEPGGFPP